MREIEYKDFSLSTHQKNWRIKKPNVCQFELTFECGLRCKHCYTDCYNNPGDISKELKTDEVKAILDKVYNSGVIWLCFTGGDPLTRKDFLEIYDYARKKGLIMTIFTNTFSMTEEIADFLKRYPPFVIEVTLNAVTMDLYEYISQVKGSYEKMKSGLQMILDRKLPLKIKTQLTKDNFKEKDAIKKYIEGLELRFRPTVLLHPRLNKDLAPCALRFSTDGILSLDNKIGNDCINEEQKKYEFDNKAAEIDNPLFPCAVTGGDGFYIDPYGNMFLCNLIRRPFINILSGDISEGLKGLLSQTRTERFETDSRCRKCSIRNMCYNCPGKAYLETGNKESHIDYYCSLARLNKIYVTAKKNEQGLPF